VRPLQSLPPESIRSERTIWQVEATKKQLAAKDAEVKSASEKLQAAEVI